MSTLTLLVVGPFESWEQVFFAVFVSLFLVIGMWGLWKAILELWRGAAIATSDPIDAGSVYLADDEVELEGEVEAIPDEQLTSRYTDTEVVAHTYEKKERERRVDSDGTTHTHTRTLEEGRDAVPFYVRDQSGAVPIDPTDAEFSFDTELISGGHVKTYEGRLGDGDTVHVMGQKRDATTEEETIDGEETYVGDGDAVADFTISDTTELRTVARYGLSGLGGLVLFGIWTALSGLFFLAIVVEGVLGVPVSPHVDGIVNSIESLLS